MRGRAEIVACRGADGRTVLARCAGTPPLTPRATGPGRTATVHLTATAGGPLPGDEADLDVTVGAGAWLTLRSVAATVALPGPDPGAPASRWRVRATVAPGGTLVVLGEPLIAAAGCRHVATAVVALSGDARLVWRELLVPGRSGERCGAARQELRVTRDRRPILSQALAVGPGSPGWESPAVLGGARCAGTLLLAGPAAWRPDAVVRRGAGAALMPLAIAGAALGSALGDPPDVRAALDSWLPPLDEPAESLAPHPAGETMDTRL